MKFITLLTGAAALAGCAATLGSLPTVAQLQAEVAFVEGWKILETVNCEGRNECYNRAFGLTKVRNANCVALAAHEAECSYEVLIENHGNQWETRRSILQIGSGPDGKIGWRLVSPAVN